MTLKTTAYGSMQPVEFRAYHGPALELQEVKHGLILNALGQLGGEKSVEVSYWTLGRPGECTIRMGHHLIVLGALDEKQCRNLADLTAHTDYPGVIGPDMTPKWFTDRAREPRVDLERAASENRFLFWIDNAQAVSMAGIARRLKTSAVISAVYTPPELRGRGYAGSVTAAMVERIYIEGHKIACLYADLRNPASNRCYTKIGFRPVCKSFHFHRDA